MEEWQPIATAPKNGTAILLTDGYGSTAVARWDDQSFPGVCKENSRWAISDWHNDPIHLRGGYRATHWMPLPAPPKGKER